MGVRGALGLKGVRGGLGVRGVRESRESGRP